VNGSAEEKHDESAKIARNRFVVRRFVDGEGLDRSDKDFWDEWRCVRDQRQEELRKHKRRKRRPMSA
jgi:hypothetical protein